MSPTSALQHRLAVVRRHIAHLERLIAGAPEADRDARERLLDELYAEAARLDAAIAATTRRLHPLPASGERAG